MASLTREQRKALTNVLGDLQAWHHQCHAASIHVVKSGVLGPSRVARGSCRGVAGQHSWVVLGYDCYDRKALIVDPTLWSYRKDVTGIFIGPQNVYNHTPHGTGSIFGTGKPGSHGGDAITLPGPFSPQARVFLEMVGPLDQRGWAELVHSPVEGWPAAEIIDRMADHPKLKALVPIDILGMLTARNPSGLYLP